MFSFPGSLRTIINRLDPSAIEESCGYCYKVNNRWICEQVENVAEDKRENFEFSVNSMIAFDVIESEKFVWHTHLRHEHVNLSSDDIRTAKSWPTPILMFNMRTSVWDYFDPFAPRPPYIGRKWIYSYQHCYTLIQDYYKQELNIQLPDFYLEEPKSWINSNWNMFAGNIGQVGFVEVHRNDIRQHDLLLFKIGRSNNPNHIGVVLEPTTGEFLHHLGEHLSSRDVLTREYRKRLISVWRHETLN